MNLNDLQPDDFEDCFVDEPNGSSDASIAAAADLNRGRTALRRRRILLGSTATGIVALACMIAGMQPAMRMSIEPASPSQPTNSIPTENPTSTASSSSPPFLAPNPYGDVPEPVLNPDPTGRSFLFPPDSNRRLYYASNISDPAPRSAKPKVSRARALTRATKELGNMARPGAKPAIALRMMSNSSDEPDIDGVSSNPHLYWVAQVDSGSELLPSGGGMHTGQSNPTQNQSNLKLHSCWAQIYINATTGGARSIFQTCIPR